MAVLVLTVLGDDQAGLVHALSGVITDHGGNWERSQMAQLAGKFAGIVMVTVPDQEAEAFVDDLAPLETKGLLDVTVEHAAAGRAAPPSIRLSLELVGQDRPGIVRDISHALAVRQVSIEELRTETRSAPMAGGVLFEATATLVAPADSSLDELGECLEELANELMVDIDLSERSED